MENARTPTTFVDQPAPAGEFLLRHRTAVTEPRLRPSSDQPRPCLPFVVPFTRQSCRNDTDDTSATNTARARHDSPARMYGRTHEQTNACQLLPRLLACLVARSLPRPLARPRSTV
jgi:hypothetical protein